MDPKLIDLINVGYVLVFVVLVVLALVRIAYRYGQYKREDLPVPALLPRDLFLFAGLAFPFIGVLIFRAFGISAREQDWYIPWVLISNSLAVFGVGYWVYYEYFKVEKS